MLESDPFNDLDSSQAEVDPELLDLMQQTSGNDHCSQDCYVDNDVPTCFEMEDENWEEECFAELEPPSKTSHADDAVDDDEGSEDEDIQEDPSPPSLKIKSYTQALSALEDISLFLQSKGHVSEANKIMNCSSNIALLHCHLLSTSRQTTLFEFMDHN